MSTLHRYEAASIDSDLPPPSPARFISRQNTPPAPLSQLTTSATLIDDLSRHGHSESDEYSLHKRPPSPESPPASPRRSASPHTPIAATVVFARNAPPLSLPMLDAYLSKLSPPSFTEAKGKEPAMFPPMDKLAKSGDTIENLEANFKPAPWYRNRNTLLGSLISTIIGTTGSSAVATFYSLEGLNNTVQLFALILSTIVPIGDDVTDKWRQLFLGTIPNILALNFVSTVNQSLVFLVLFLLLTVVLLYFFQRASSNYDRYRIVEGLQPVDSPRSRAGLVTITFLLTAIYLPLSTMAVHVLVWSSDLWAVPSPYTNATTFPPVLPPLGPSSEYRDPLDFCWTTTMKRNEINYAPALVILAVIVLGFLTIWFPLALRQMIKQSVPLVDRYTELGRLRNSQEMDTEYHRLLSRDRNPFAFLYSGFRRNWGTYEAIYLFAKLSALFVVAVIDSNNCFFRTLSQTAVPIARQVLLVILTLGFFIAQCVLGPFLDPINNASEWISRLNYVTTAALALAVALDIPGKSILETYVLYIIYIITYGFSIYFTLIHTALIQRAVKRLTRRVDFSIDIFSPRLDTSPNSMHTKRRIWQESITTLFLTSPECQIPTDQPMEFAQARDFEHPPYLLRFSGHPAERHIENIKILREIGSLSYHQGVALITGPDYEWFKHLEEEIQQHFVGPDCYWRASDLPQGVTSPFGNAWWIPFPPTLIIRYDDGPSTVIQDVSDLEAYIRQNSSRQVQRKRELRMALRALEGQIVVWPYKHITPIGSHLWCCARRYKADNSVAYHSCVLRIKRRGHLKWDGLQLGSGFDIELNYAKDVKVDGDIIGLNDDYDLTPDLARFIALNQDLIPRRLEHIEETLASYRRHHKKECRWKSHVLTYRFLTHVYDRPRESSALAESSIQFERDLRVRELMVGNEAVFQTAYERLEAVSATPTATWWYLFWDDLWRRNYDTISGLTLHASDFDPHYPTSIAYRPLPRAALESFLVQRGMLSKQHFFHSGLLNKLYLRLNETVFHGFSRGITFHVGNHTSELDMEEVDVETQAQGSTLGTGPGTDHDASSIRPRPAYRWEGLLQDPYHSGRRHRRFFAKLGAWLGLTPVWRTGIPSNGISLDVRLDRGRYVVIGRDSRRTPVLAETIPDPTGSSSTWSCIPSHLRNYKFVLSIFIAICLDDLVLLPEPHRKKTRP
ncbi:hypothetical protein B0H17DRAFT_919193 [Mycena rosella]|uniref:Uncharacterized protein n=1 Tax=Mycena rosella TaxID=1033263 RepID=A0AAD7M8Y7_MYCRO|nr:hypothetical protein B0H17DRAFT_919193 [Mycena rosella]